MANATLSQCPVCLKPFLFDESASVPYRAGDSVPAGVRAPSRIDFCKECHVGIGFPLFTEADEAAIYETGEFWKTAPSRISLKQLAVPLAQAEERFRFIRQAGSWTSPRPLRILDVGAGQGAFGLVAALDPTAHLGSYTAVEPDKRLLNDLEGFWKRLRVPATLHQAGDLKALAPRPGSYDLIILSHVVEHIREPGGVLHFIKPFLAPHGHLFIEVPAQDFRFKAAVFPHILFFNRLNLDHLLHQNGFRVSDSGVFGRNHRVNPLGQHLLPRDRIAQKAMSTCAGILPLALQKTFYRKFFGINQRNDEGIWLRTVATALPPSFIPE